MKMKKRIYQKFMEAFILLLLFAIFTVCVKTVDVQSVGPEDSMIGFAKFNTAVHNLAGVNLLWYNITDWLGLVPVIFAFGMAVLGFCQMISRRSLFKVDLSLLLLGTLYILVIGCYIFFEKCVINYRPVILGKNLEASYPSSHIMIAITILWSGLIVLQDYIKSKKTYNLFCIFFLSVIFITVFGRFISGVHWATDIIGGLLISAGLVNLYKTSYDIMLKR